MKKNYVGLISTIVFLAVIIWGITYSFRDAYAYALTELFAIESGTASVVSSLSEFESNYNSVFSSKEWSLDAYSLVQRMLGKHETRNFEVLKSDDGQLYLHGEEEQIDKEKLMLVADEYETLYDETRSYGGMFLYVQCPYKNVGTVEELSDYSSDTTEDAESYLVQLLENKGIPVFDLRDYEECCKYYKNDHHWTVEAAFNASRLIAEKIQRVYDINLAKYEYYGNMENYNTVTFKNCFLGSIGIKVGPFFTGRDDFTVYNPKFETDLILKHYVDSKLQFKYSGDFWETFIDDDMLGNSDYNNKYDANMHGAYVESIIENKLAQNDYHGLLITHSYGRAMAQYMCLNYSELRYLDPQLGRYNGNYIEYIKEYQPDIVILMYNSEININNGSWQN